MRLLISAAQTPADLAAMVERRIAGLPLEHVLDWAEFSGLRIAVGPGVFVPRRRTELLACQAAAFARQALARQSLVWPGAVVGLCNGDIYEPLPVSLRGRVDVLVAGTPDVPTETIRLLPPEARVHEPRVALDGGADGLDVLRRVITAAPLWPTRGVTCHPSDGRPGRPPGPTSVDADCGNRSSRSWVNSYRNRSGKHPEHSCRRQNRRTPSAR